MSFLGKTDHVRNFADLEKEAFHPCACVSPRWLTNSRLCKLIMAKMTEKEAVLEAERVYFNIFLLFKKSIRGLSREVCYSLIS